MPARLTTLWTCGIIALWLTVIPGFAITNTHSIEGYSDVLSVAPGGKVKFSVHVPAGRTQYSVEIFRYGTLDDGGNAIGQSVAGPFSCSNGRRRNFDAFNAYVNGAKWPASFTLKVPSATSNGIAPCTLAVIPKTTWRSGFYTAKITDIVTGEYFHITFIVKDNAKTQKSIALIASTNTWTAYNFWPGQSWGGSSIYDGCGSPGRSEVTFLRPNPYASPEAHDDVSQCPYLPYYRTEHLAAGELRVAHWLENNGLSYSTLTDWDLASISGVLDPAVFKTVIITTHSEYWSQSMYDALMNYMARGGNVISLSGNTVFWQINLNVTPKNRTLQKLGNWTPQQQAKLLGLGSFGSSGVGNADCVPYDLDLPNHWAFQNLTDKNAIGFAGVILGTTTCLDGGHGAGGWEVDRTDPSVHVFAREYALLAESRNQLQHANLSYMRRASAGQVLSAGSITFGQSLVVDQPLSTVLLTILPRFNKLSFSDFSGDGKPDLLARKPDGTLWRYNGDGLGGLIAGVQIGSAWDGFDIVLSPSDFDGDGNADVIARDFNGRLWLYRGKGDGTLQPSGVQIGTGWQGFDSIVSPGDFDGDGNADLLARKPDGTLWLYSGNGTGGLITPAGPFNTGWQIYDALIAPGDFDEDRFPDLLARKPDGTLWLYRGDGHGNFISGAVQIDANWNQFVEMVTPGDFNGDGHADVLGRKADGTLWMFNGSGDGHIQQNGGVLINVGWDIFNTVIGVW